MLKHMVTCGFILVAVTSFGLVTNVAAAAPMKCAALFESHDRLKPSIGFAGKNLLRYEASVSNQILERTYIIDPFLVALIAKEHILMVGPPGNAKTTLAKTLLQNIVDAKTGKSDFYSIQMNKEVTLADTHGGLNFGLLKDGVVQRKYEDGALGAKLGFFDEVFDVRPGALRNTLDILAERSHSQGTKQHVGQTQMVIAATNKTLPEVYADFNNSEGPRAVIDRFAFVFYVPKEMMSIKSDRMIFSGKRASLEPIHQLTFQDLDAIRSLLPKVDVPDYISYLAQMMHHRLGPEFESREVKSMELYREQIANGEQALPPYRAAKYLSPRTLAKAGGILKSIVVLDYIRKNGARDLTATPEDLERLRLFYQMNGPKDEDLNAQLSRAAKDHEKNQITIVQSERKIVDPLFEAVIKDFNEALARREIPPFGAMASRFDKLSLPDRRRLADLMKATYRELRNEFETWRSNPDEIDQKEISSELASASALIDALRKDAAKIWGVQAPKVIADWERDFVPKGKVKPRIQRKSDFRYREYNKAKSVEKNSAEPTPPATERAEPPTAEPTETPAAELPVTARTELPAPEVSPSRRTGTVRPITKVEAVLKNSLIPTGEINPYSLVTFPESGRIQYQNAIEKGLSSGTAHIGVLPNTQASSGNWAQWNLNAALDQSHVAMAFYGERQLHAMDAKRSLRSYAGLDSPVSLQREESGHVISFHNDSVHRIKKDLTTEPVVWKLYENTKLGSLIPGLPDKYAVMTENGNSMKLLITGTSAVEREYLFPEASLSELKASINQPGAALHMADVHYGFIAGNDRQKFFFVLPNEPGGEIRWKTNENWTHIYALSPDGRLIASNNGGSMIRLLDAKVVINNWALSASDSFDKFGALSARGFGKFSTLAEPKALKFSPDGKSIYAVSEKLIEQFELKIEEGPEPEILRETPAARGDAAATAVSIRPIRLTLGHQLTNPSASFNTTATIPLGTPGKILSPGKALPSGQQAGIRPFLSVGTFQSLAKSPTSWTPLNDAVALGTSDAIVRDEANTTWHMAKDGSGGTKELTRETHSLRREPNGDVTLFQTDSIVRVTTASPLNPQTIWPHPTQTTYAGSLVPGRPGEYMTLISDGTKPSLLHIDPNSQRSRGIELPFWAQPAIQDLIVTDPPKLFMVDRFHGILRSSKNMSFFFSLDPTFKIESASSTLSSPPMALSNDGKLIASSSNTNSTGTSEVFVTNALEFWNAHGSTSTNQLSIQVDIGDIKSLRFAPDGKSLLVISEERIQEINIETFPAVTEEAKP